MAHQKPRAGAASGLRRLIPDVDKSKISFWPNYSLVLPAPDFRRL